jgi:hypothetical protein
MTSGRLEAFSDGVIAIIITIMVLELKVPHGDRLRDLAPLVPTFLSYVLSFRLCRHLLEQPPSHAACLRRGQRCDALGQSAPLVLALAISVHYGMDGGKTSFTASPTALYGVVLLMAAIAYYLLQQAIIRAQGPNSVLKKAIGRDWKGKLSPVLYIIAIVCYPAFRLAGPDDSCDCGADMADSGPAHRKASCYVKRSEWRRQRVGCYDIRIDELMNRSACVSSQSLPFAHAGPRRNRCASRPCKLCSDVS